MRGALLSLRPRNPSKCTVVRLKRVSWMSLLTSRGVASRWKPPYLTSEPQGEIGCSTEVQIAAAIAAVMAEMSHERWLLLFGYALAFSIGEKRGMNEEYTLQLIGDGF